MNIKSTRKQLREFSLLLGIGIPLFFGTLIPLILNHHIRIWTIFIGIPILIIGLLSPNKLRPVYKFWIYIGDTLGWINSRIVLGLVFLFVLQPISLIMKLSGHDPLRMKKSKKKSYREKCDTKTVNFTKIF